MLLDLKSLDVNICHCQSADKGNGDKTGGILSRQGATKSMPRNHQHSRCSEEGENDDKVSIEPVEKHRLVTNGGNELEDDEEGCGEYRREVQYYSDFLMPAKVVKALPWSRMVAARVTSTAEDSIEIEILESSQSEAHESACEDEPENKVIALFESDGMVDFAHGAYEGGLACFIRVRHDRRQMIGDEVSGKMGSWVRTGRNDCDLLSTVKLRDNMRRLFHSYTPSELCSSRGDGA